jgi:hypothetical protein
VRHRLLHVAARNRPRAAPLVRAHRQHAGPGASSSSPHFARLHALPQPITRKPAPRTILNTQTGDTDHRAGRLHMPEPTEHKTQSDQNQPDRDQRPTERPGGNGRRRASWIGGVSDLRQ